MATSGTAEEARNEVHLEPINDDDRDQVRELLLQVQNLIDSD